jgi:hypothetical protein
MIGADAGWLAALGRIIASHHAIPAGVPFATAPTAHWPNAIVMAELLFHALQATLAARGLVLAQVVAVGFSVAVVTWDAIGGGAKEEATASAVLIAAVGALGSLAVVRVQLFSLALFPLLLALLRSEARSPSRRIWLILPLVALWSNLHGTVLIGVGIIFVYLALVRSRMQPGVALGVACGALVALCATPAGLRTPDYYYGVLTNEAAQHGLGLWTPLSLGSPLDVVLIVAVIALVVRVRRRALPGWELVATLGLAMLTLQAGRSGVWLLMFLVAPAAKGFKSRPLLRRCLPALATMGLLLLVTGLVRGPLPSGATPEIVSRAVSLAHGTPVLADDLLAEQVALAGGRVWVSNPIDAFPKPIQTAFLDWAAGRSSAAPHRLQIHVVLTRRGSAAQKLMAHQRAFSVVGSDSRSVIYERKR